MIGTALYALDRGRYHYSDPAPGRAHLRVTNFLLTS